MNKNILTLLIGILAAFIFFLQYLLPYMNIPKNSGMVFTPFNGGDENVYAAQVREVFEGKPFSGDAYLYETKNKIPFVQLVPPLLVGYISRLTGSMEIVYLGGCFVFPIIIFFLIYKLIYLITKHYWGAIIGSFATLFLYQLTTKFPPITPSLFKGFIETLTLNKPFVFSFNRLIPQQIGFMFFMIFILAFYLLLASSKKRWIYLTGISTGLLAYNYLYYWTTSMGVLCVAIFLCFLSGQKKKVNKLIIALFIAGLTSFGLILQQFSAPFDKQISEGRINGRFIEILTTLRYGIFSLIITWWVKKPLHKIFILSFFLTAIVLMNIQLILGYTLSPGHWPSSTFEPLLVIFTSILLCLKFKNIFPDKWKTGLLIIPILIYAILNQIKITRDWQSQYYLSQSEISLYRWLNQNTKPESVILTLDKRLNRYLPVLTHNNLFLPYASFTQISNPEIWNRINLAFSFYNLGDNEIRQKLSESQFIGQLFEQTYSYHKLSDLTNLVIPDEVKKEIRKRNPVYFFGFRYVPDNLKNENVTKTQKLIFIPLKERICHYRLDYLIIDHQNIKYLKNDLSPEFFERVFKEGNFELYKVKNICSL